MGFSKVIQSGDLIEIYEYEKNISQVVKRKRKRRQFKSRKLYRSVNVYQRKQRFARLVRANLWRSNAPFFLTLTSAKVVNIEQAYQWLTMFYARLRRTYGDAFRYIAVPEFQKRGAVHFHCLIWDFDENILKNERNLRILQHQWQRGTLDSFPTDGNVRLAGYFAKYMAKSLYDVRLRNKKAFVCSRNVVQSVSIPFATAVSYAKDIWEIDLHMDTPLQDKTFDTQWLGKGRYRAYKI